MAQVNRARVWSWLWVNWPFKVGEYFLWKRTIASHWVRPEKSERDTGVEDPHLWKMSR